MVYVLVRETENIYLYDNQKDILGIFKNLDDCKHFMNRKKEIYKNNKLYQRETLNIYEYKTL